MEKVDGRYIGIDNDKIPLFCSQVLKAQDAALVKRKPSFLDRNKESATKDLVMLFCSVAVAQKSTRKQNFGGQHFNFTNTEYHNHRTCSRSAAFLELRSVLRGQL